MAMMASKGWMRLLDPEDEGLIEAGSLVVEAEAGRSVTEVEPRRSAVAEMRPLAEELALDA